MDSRLYTRRDQSPPPLQSRLDRALKHIPKTSLYIELDMTPEMKDARNAPVTAWWGAKVGTTSRTVWDTPAYPLYFGFNTRLDLNAGMAMLADWMWDMIGDEGTEWVMGLMSEGQNPSHVLVVFFREERKSLLTTLTWPTIDVTIETYPPRK